MNIIYQLQTNLLSPIILSFFLGMLAAFIRSDLKIPQAVHETISIYLLFAIGLKGGLSLQNASLVAVSIPALATLFLGLLTPVIAFMVLQHIGRFSLANSAAIAAHYGSVSIITFIAAMAYLDAIQVPYEGFMPSLLVLLEIPGIFMALLLVRMLRPGYKSNLKEGMLEILGSRSVLLLIGGLLIGYVSSPDQYALVEPFFHDMFPGFLAIFLLEMGIIAAAGIKDVRVGGLFLVCFGILVPIFHGMLGVVIGHFVGLTIGGSVLLGTMAASASYIAAPAAVRMALPEANPALYLTPSLVVTFPFNIVIGIPLYYFIGANLLSFLDWIK